MNADSSNLLNRELFASQVTQVKRKKQVTVAILLDILDRVISGAGRKSLFTWDRVYGISTSDYAANAGHIHSDQNGDYEANSLYLCWFLLDPDYYEHIGIQTCPNPGSGQRLPAGRPHGVHAPDRNTAG
jgi:hypothetical protein